MPSLTVVTGYNHDTGERDSLLVILVECHAIYLGAGRLVSTDEYTQLSHEHRSKYAIPANSDASQETIEAFANMKFTFYGEREVVPCR